MIELRDVSVHYGTANNQVAALEHVSLAIPRGSVCTVIGPSGCGKSTLLQAIARLLPGVSGEVLAGGVPLRPKEQKIGFMPQNYGLLPWKTVEENVLLGCRIKGEAGSGAKARMEKLLLRLGIAGMEQRYPQELSGGQRQRVSLARVFLMEPDILLMDEPFSALDAITREDMQEVFLALWREQAVTTVLVTHYVEEALYLGQKIVLMAARPGRVVEVMDNPFFGSGSLYDRPEFFAMGRRLRNKIKEMGNKG